MSRQSYLILIAFVFIFSLTACRLTRSDVIGKWKEHSGADTLIIYNDNSFLFIKGNTGMASGGHWILYKKAIHFEFSDSTQSFGDGCKTYTHWWTRSSKRSLVRPDRCNTPTHHFSVITKIN
ncbi:MAG TPA: hypothetical protein VF008_06145 [Niastella sp.]